MLALGLRILQIALAAICVLLLYWTVAPFVGQTAVPEATLAELELPEAPVSDLASLQVIQNRNLFATPEAPDAAPAGEDELLEESALRFELRGTAAAEIAEASVAVLVDPTRQESFVVRVRDKLGSTGAEVERIERRRIVILNQGKREQISLMESDDGAAAPAGLARAMKRAVSKIPSSRAALRRSRQERAEALGRPSGRAGSRPSRTGSDDAIAAAAAETALREAEALAASAAAAEGPPAEPRQGEWDPSTSPRQQAYPDVRLAPNERWSDINGQPIGQPGEVQQMLRQGGAVTIGIMNDATGEYRQVVVNP